MRNTFTHKEQTELSRLARIAIRAAQARSYKKGPRPFWTISAPPYLFAIMGSDYGYEDPVMCVLYALNNLTGWRGPEAKATKAAINAIIKPYLVK